MQKLLTVQRLCRGAMSGVGPNPDFLLGGRTSASAECRHWSERAVRWSSCAILLSYACARRRWRSRSARPSSCKTTRTLSGSSAISMRWRRLAKLNATIRLAQLGRAGDVAALAELKVHADLKPLAAHRRSSWVACGPAVPAAARSAARPARQRTRSRWARLRR